MKSSHISKEPVCHFRSDNLRDLHSSSQHLAHFGSSIIYFYSHDTAYGDWYLHKQLSQDSMNDISLCQTGERDISKLCFLTQKWQYMVNYAFWLSSDGSKYINHSNSKSLLHPWPLCNRLVKRSYLSASGLYGELLALCRTISVMPLTLAFQKSLVSRSVAWAIIKKKMLSLLCW